MDLSVFAQSTAANLVLIFAYLAYKGCNRLVTSKCHYTTKDGWDIHLPDAEDPPDAGEVDLVNRFMKERGISMRLRERDFSSRV